MHENDPIVMLVGEPGATLAENVRLTLIDLIMKGVYDEGARLYPERLAEQLGVSMTPVREALMQLAADGFVEGVQRRGFHVRTPDPRQVTNLWQVRQGLELTAGELAIARRKANLVSDADIEYLAGLQRQQEASETLANHLQKLDLNGRLHTRIVELSGNEVLVSLYQSIRTKVAGSLVQRGLNTWRGRLEAESAEHWGLINAIRDADFVAFDRATRKHLARSLKDALADLEARRAHAAIVQDRSA
ncbi:transcriptional regulator [Youhaiella tibetensis]|uniref:GntR family transcriptional regulator n=1 Tax=Paradevosia tibetensis TaxID=1447062 RepID=A0A5B9DL10_9HYPH|nr:GntR family transcriptional regulator [Youhaiella tibetensis]AKR58220.1 GntR family transcriptional regulator [Devosia sp. H5989]QEE19078.1 GntR family transcriptional regulator [Youhaiella tibetensis]GGF36525.1 transcriptional regulator [Youhaiella tibetensis]